MRPALKVWYVSSQRLCNFNCRYCVSTNAYAKSSTTHWREPGDLADFQKVVRWLGSREIPVGVRLATLGEPFATWDFLSEAGWLTQQPQVCFVELLTNASLLRQRLPRFSEMADLSKVSLWATHHHTEISIDRFVANLHFAQQEYGCFTVANALLFPGNAGYIAELRDACDRAGIRFHLDLGYDPGTATGDHSDVRAMVPILQTPNGIEVALRLGADPDMIQLNLHALEHTYGHSCAAGSDYIYIGIDGEVYPCSRYYVLRSGRLGNVLDDGFDFQVSHMAPWRACQASAGCCNKEDFLNLKSWRDRSSGEAPSLGWATV